ncbi:AAA family ATPase [Peribacillus butanolivorans]|uniref:AAA family ATPase n=1 Tax=Peribacillus butanolivorans TaxID=421767 RepID=UPI00363057E9
MKKIEKIEDLKKDTIITEQKLLELFKCSAKGGMRRSLKTNSLVLLSFKGRKPYGDAKKDGEIWEFVGMGRNGDQKVDYLQNKTLLNSNENGVKVYLFTVENKEYKFVDRVLLAGSWKTEKEEGEDGKDRTVLVFPLIEVGRESDMLNFLLSHTKDSLVEEEYILSYPAYDLSLHSVDPLASLMRRSGVDTLTAPGGWYFTKTKFFNNPNTGSKYKNGYIEEIIQKEPKVSKGIVFEGQNKFINPFFRTSNNTPVYKKPKNISESEGEGFLIHKIQYKYPKSNLVVIDFVEKKITDIKNQDNPFVSLLIGPNGTGKSTVLGNVQKIFLDAFNYADSRKTQSMANDIEYEITYQFGTELYKIKHDKDLNTKEYYKGEERASFHEIFLPRKVLTVAFSINDRFTFNQQSENSSERYSYLGIKSSDNTARVGETTKNLVLNILRSSQKDDFNKNLKYITGFINVEAIFRIKYFFKNGALSEYITIENITRLQNKLRTQPKKDIEHINFIDNKDITDFYEKLLAGNYDNNIFRLKEDSISIDFNLNFEDGNNYNYYYEEFHILWHLFELGIFKDPTVYLKKGCFYKLEDASSGEAQYITTLINILANIEKDSLIIIDEPETSLHPNWQYKYVQGIREIFSNFSSCHFVMATHSHFLISDLTPDASSITSIRKEKNNELVFELHDEKTFGWNPDDILYNIFYMKTARNSYLEEDLRTLLSYISSGDTCNREKVKSIFEKLDKLTLRPNDPLKKLINNARGYFENA